MRHSETDSSVNSTSISKYWLRYNYSCGGVFWFKESCSRDAHQRDFQILKLQLPSSGLLFQNQECFDYKVKRKMQDRKDYPTEKVPEQGRRQTSLYVRPSWMGQRDEGVSTAGPQRTALRVDERRCCPEVLLLFWSVTSSPC